jgi:hypothetical protein
MKISESYDLLIFLLVQSGMCSFDKYLQMN